MKIFILADYRRDDVRSLTNNARKFTKGFLRQGHDVYAFSYRDTLMQLSPIRSKQWANLLAKSAADRFLVDVARQYEPDMIFITAFRLLDEKTVLTLRHACPSVQFVGWYGDLTAGIDPRVGAIAPHCDWFLSTSGTQVLQRYHQAGAPRCAFMPNPCDPDLEHPYSPEPRFECDMMFTGKLRHGQPGQDPMREKLLTQLIEQGRLRAYGAMGQPAVYGLDYYRAISSCKIALSINSFNDIRCYHSDRLVHYLGCGAFVLAKYVPDSEWLFVDNEHICYFCDVDECKRLLKRYLADSDARNHIARQGMARAHEEFNCSRLAAQIVSLVKTGRYDASWGEIVA